MRESGFLINKDMILEQETFDKYGHKPSELLPLSKKIIIGECDYCHSIFEKEKWKMAKSNRYIAKDCCGKHQCHTKKIRESRDYRLSLMHPNIGDKFNHLTMISSPFKKERKTEKNKNYFVSKFKCDCGRIKTLKVTQVKNGYIKSCGCTKIDCSYTICFHGDSGKKLHSIWTSMKQRCSNPTDAQYHNYGAKGIVICEDWSKNNYLQFKEWSIKHGYKEGLSIDRIDPRLVYCPENCEWVTKAENSRRVTGSRDKIIKKQEEEIVKLKQRIIELENQLLVHE